MSLYRPLSWVNRLFRPARRATIRKRTHPLLSLEVLENRENPTTFQVTNLVDVGPLPLGQSVHTANVAVCTDDGSYLLSQISLALSQEGVAPAQVNAILNKLQDEFHQDVNDTHGLARIIAATVAQDIRGARLAAIVHNLHVQECGPHSPTCESDGRHTLSQIVSALTQSGIQGTQLNTIINELQNALNSSTDGTLGLGRIAAILDHAGVSRPELAAIFHILYMEDCDDDGGGGGGGGGGGATPVVTITTGSSTVAEGGSTTINFTRTGNTDAPLTVNYTVGGTATSGTDFTPLSGTVTFAAGSATAQVTVAASRDNLVDPNETIVATLASAAGYTVDGQPATVTIQDDPPIVTVVKIADATEGGTEGLFRFTRTGGDLSDSLTADYIIGGTATAITDYTPLSGTVTFAAGQNTLDVAIVAVDDTIDEPDEAIVVTLSPSTRYIPGVPDSATALILDNDGGGDGGGGGGDGGGTGGGEPSPQPPLEAARVRLFASGSGAVIEGGNAIVKVFNIDTTERFTLTPFIGYHGEVNVAVGDVSGDGVEDIIVGVGPNAPGGHVKVFDGATGAEIRSFFTFDGYTGGVHVGAGDVNRDGFRDIIVGADAGASGGHVKVFSGRDGSLLHSFMSFDGYTGGVRVAGGDVDGDGFSDIVVGATTAGFGVGFTPGIVQSFSDVVMGLPGAGGHVKVFSGRTGAEIRSFFAYTNYNGGLSVGAGDTNGDGFAEIFTSTISSHIKVFDGLTGAERASYLGFSNFLGEARISATDLQGDGLAEVVIGAGPFPTGGHIKVFGGQSQILLESFFAYPGFIGGIFVG